MAKGSPSRSVKYTLTADQHKAVQAFLQTEQAAAKSERRFQKVTKSGHQVSQSMEKMRGTVMRLAAAYIGINSARAMGGFIINTVNAADAIAKQAHVAGISAEKLQEYRYVAERSGVTNEQLNTGLQRLNRSISQASEGTGAQAEIFKRLGISVKDARGQLKTTDQVLIDIAERFSNSEDAVSKVRAAMEIFGRGGAPMINMLNEGSEGIEQLIKRARALDLVRSNAEINRAETAGDVMDDVKLRIQAGFQKFVFQNQERLIAASESTVEVLNKIFANTGEVLKWLPLGIEYQKRKASDELAIQEDALKMMKMPRFGRSPEAIAEQEAKVAELRAKFNELNEKFMGVGKYAPVDIPSRGVDPRIQALLEELGDNESSTDRNTRAVERLTDVMNKPTEEERQAAMNARSAQVAMVNRMTTGSPAGGPMAALMARIPMAVGGRVPGGGRIEDIPEMNRNTVNTGANRSAALGGVTININQANFASPAAAVRMANARAANSPLGAF